ncbi:MAG: hypothetical protein GY928_36540 [Colwellia sp.]|nr:hypothetical protein [Colwellia sp.]
MAQLTLPRPTSDPTGLSKVEAKAYRDFNRRIKGAYAQIIRDVIMKLEYRVIKLNESAQHFVKNDKLYRYELDASILANLGGRIREIIDSWLMVDKYGNFVGPYNPETLWFMQMYVSGAYQKGSKEAYDNLSTQSEVYRLAIPAFIDLLQSEPYVRRVGLLAARQYEGMKGFSDSMVKVTQQVLSEGTAAGIGVREMAKQLQERTADIHHLDSARAVRIVQSEVPGALRKAKAQEAESADEKFGIKSMLMPISAFMKTSRKTHVKRSGTLVTYQEQAEFYSKAKNSISCHCSVIVVVVDKNGVPLAPGLVKKAEEQRERLSAMQD